MKYEGSCQTDCPTSQKKIPTKYPASLGLKHFNDCKAFIEYSSDMDDIYRNIEEYNPSKNLKILGVFDYMIADKKINRIVTELFIRD